MSLARDAGKMHYGLWFSPHFFLTGSRSSAEIDPDSVSQRKLLLSEARKLGIEPVGILTTWVFPSFAGARPTRGPLGAPAAIPSFDSSEYERLRAIRREMFATWVREFPEVVSWVVGAESTLYYYDESGADLNSKDLVRFFVDTLADANTAVKSANPEAVVVAHFVAGDTPTSVKGQLIQPREMVSLTS